MPWYRTGTVAITAGQTTVTGTGTNFTLNARVGDAFQGPDGRWYEVANIASATVLGILPAYQGSTVTAGTYGLAPMQGYVKDAADRLRQIVDQWGSTLALFGGATDVITLRTNIGAAKNGANSDITALSGLTTALSVAQGGTGATNAAAARTALGMKAAALADILGTVSQASGVPTGAVIEKGSNTNGDYVKFADGTLICWRRVLGPTFSTAQYLQIEWQYPAVFIAAPVVIPMGIAGIDQIKYNRGSLGATGSATSATIRLFATGTDTFTSGDGSSAQAFAIGRWFS